MSVRRPRAGGVVRRASSLGAAAVVVSLLLAGCGDETSSGGTADDPTDAAATSSATSGSPTTDSPSPSPGDPASSATGTSGSPTVPAVVYPACTKVWVDGKRLSQDFDGCLQAGKLVRPDGRYCEFGMPLITFGTHFYAVPGGIIHRTAKPLKQDPGYQKAVTLCQG